MTADDAEKGQRDRRQDDQRQPERAELRHDQHIYAEQRYGKCCAHIAECDPGHLPFAIPQQHRRVCVVRLAVQPDFRLLKIPPCRGVKLVGDRQHSIKRGLEIAGQFAGYHHGIIAIVPEHRI